jgi:hypothetical protein
MRYIIILSLFLTACTTTSPVVVPYSKPTLAPQPRYPIQDLKPGDTPDTVIKGYVATVLGLQDYINHNCKPYFNSGGI